MSDHYQDLERQEENASRILLPESIEYLAAHECTDVFHVPFEFIIPLSDKLMADACAEYLGWTTGDIVSVSLLFWVMDQYDMMSEEERSRFLAVYGNHMKIIPF